MLQDILQRATLGLVAILLIKFGVDFTAEMRLPISAAFWVLVLATLALGWAHVRSATQRPALSLRKRGLLLAAIPLAFLAASLDCTGVAPGGCSRPCSLVKLGMTPLIAAGCVAYIISGRKWILTAIMCGALVTLVPHCVCYNAANRWWIDLIGASPVCYVWGVAVTVISVGALRTGDLVRWSLLVCYAIIGGATAFFIGHHYLDFPW
jgi:hypothetical protein